MVGFNQTLTKKISSATTKMEKELTDILKVFSNCDHDVAGHKWITCSYPKINAYAHILEDTYEIDEDLQVNSLEAITESFKTDFSISDAAAKVLYKYDHNPTDIIPEDEALLKAGVAKISNFDGYIVQHSNLNVETMTALKNSFSNEIPIQLGTIQKAGDNKFLMASSPLGSTFIFGDRPNILFIKSKTGKFITPVAHEEEPEVLFIGATKQFKVKNMLKSNTKTLYFLDEL
jgi:hypothetical protein